MSASFARHDLRSTVAVDLDRMSVHVDYDRRNAARNLMSAEKSAARVVQNLQMRERQHA